MNLFPSWLKGVVGSVFKIPIKMTYWYCSKHLLPIFANLLSEEVSTSPQLFSSWLVSNCTQYPVSSPERTPDFLGRRIMALNFAAIHTSTFTACNLLLDVFSHPTIESLLRDESLASNAHWNSKCSRVRLSQMLRLDSSLRESQRLWGVVPKAMSRKIIHPHGTTLPNGQHLPQGATVCVSGWGLHHDEALYPRSFEFVHDRFMRAPLDDEKKKTAGTGKASAAETDEQYSAWGIGKHACPGRFFAVDLVKIILMQVLLDYEVKSLGERPANIWIEYNVIPPPNAVLSIRRRKGGISNGFL